MESYCSPVNVFALYNSGYALVAVELAPHCAFPRTYLNWLSSIRSRFHFHLLLSRITYCALTQVVMFQDRFKTIKNFLKGRRTCTANRFLKRTVRFSCWIHITTATRLNSLCTRQSSHVNGYIIIRPSPLYRFIILIEVDIFDFHLLKNAIYWSNFLKITRYDWMFNNQFSL